MIELRKIMWASVFVDRLGSSLFAAVADDSNWRITCSYGYAKSQTFDIEYQIQLKCVKKITNFKYVCFTQKR